MALSKGAGGSRGHGNNNGGVANNGSGTCKGGSGGGGRGHGGSGGGNSTFRETKLCQNCNKWVHISLQSVSPWKQTKTNAPQDGRQSLQLDRGRGCKKVATQIYKNGLVKTNRNVY